LDHKQKPPRLGIPRIWPVGIRRALLLTRHGPDCSIGLCLQEEVAALETTLSRSPTCCEGRQTVARAKQAPRAEHPVPAQCLVQQLRLRRIERVTLRTPRDRPLGRLLTQIAPNDRIWPKAAGLLSGRERAKRTLRTRRPVGSF
jgi:hypothetical protein